MSSEQITSYLEESHIFCDDQFGFRSGKSTVHALANFVHMIDEGLDGSGFYSDTWKNLIGSVKKEPVRYQ